MYLNMNFQIHQPFIVNVHCIETSKVRPPLMFFDPQPFYYNFLDDWALVCVSWVEKTPNTLDKKIKKCWNQIMYGDPRQQHGTSKGKACSRVENSRFCRWPWRGGAHVGKMVAQPNPLLKCHKGTNRNAQISLVPSIMAIPYMLGVLNCHGNTLTITWSQVHEHDD